MQYREYTVDGQGGWNELRRVRYVYYETGHVANITIKDVDDDWYRDLALFYTSDGKLWRVLWDHWKVDGGQITNYGTIKAREFFYDGPRQRYLSREVDPDTWEPTDDPQLWTDYNGPSPYGDFELTFDPQTGDPWIDETMRYLAGSGIQAQQTLAGGQPDQTSYLHGDLIDSTMLTTDAGGTAVSAVSYTAFGEPVGAIPEGFPRYQYGGGWGYESGLLTLGGADGTAPITLQHVGWRWYQPSIRRFVQRDPIGILGGLNVYQYLRAGPLAAVDPSGLDYIYVSPEEEAWRELTAPPSGWEEYVIGGWGGGAAGAAATGGNLVKGGTGVVGGVTYIFAWRALKGGWNRIWDTGEALIDLYEAEELIRRQGAKKGKSDKKKPKRPPRRPHRPG